MVMAVGNLMRGPVERTAVEAGKWNYTLFYLFRRPIDEQVEIKDDTNMLPLGMGML